MKLGLHSFLCLLVLVAQAQAADLSADATVLRRFALVASSNDGGPSRARLRFANSDAESVARVLGSLGGVRDSDLILARDTTRPALQQAFTDLRGRLGRENRAQVRREVFVYFSGHSDEEGLLLGGERVAYRELRQWIDSVGADVRIAVLDSCASGALIRLKGGVHRAPFLSDVSIQARGHAFLTASSADEAAQESDRVGAAFFTHFLLSGMRGAADANRDRRVTLNEAYQFAYSETLQRTETSRAGAQHPAYDIQLAGTGDVVMTDLRASGSRLVLVREMAGRIYVRDSADRLVVELRKEPTYPIELGLDAGRYHVVLDRDGSISKGDVELTGSGRVEVAAADLAPVAPLVSMRRGDEPEAVPAPHVPETTPTVAATAKPPSGYKHIGFDMVLAPGFRLSGDSNQPIEHGFMLGLLGHSDHVRGVQLSIAGNIARDGVLGAQIGGAIALSYGPVHGVQLAGYNLAMGGLRGAQVGYFSTATATHGPIHGAQISLVNFAKGQMRGAQAGLVNIGKGSLNGAQVGFVNVLRPERESGGVQVGLTNIQTGDDERNGVSVGLINVGHKQRGVQVGLVNVADEIDGVQVGLISYARKNNGVSIGMLPLVLNGENHLTLDWTSTSAANLGFKLGTRLVYVALGLGFTSDLDQDGDRFFSTTCGIGVHAIPRGGRFFLDIGATNTSFATRSHMEDRNRLVSSLRLQAGYAIARHLSLVAGPTLNVQTAWGDDDRRPRQVGFAEKAWTSGGTTVRIYPGLVVGLEL
jgi:hypothetical protein